MAKVLEIAARSGGGFNVGGVGSLYGNLGNIRGSYVSTESQRAMVYRTNGTITNFYIHVASNTTATTTTVVTRKNTTDGTQTLTINGGATGKFEDVSNSDTVTAGDDWHYKVTMGGVGIVTIASISWLFSANNDTVQRIGCAVASDSTASTTLYGSFFGNGDNTATENNTEFTSRTSGILKNLFVNISANARVNTTTFRSRKNGADGNLTVAPTAGATGTFEDTSNSDSISSGDTVNWSITTGTGSEVITYETVAAEFLTTDQTHHYTSGDAASGIAHSPSTTQYHPIGGTLVSNTTEANVIMESNLNFTASKLQCYISANTVTSNSQLRFRKNGANGNQLVTITASTTGVFEDAVNTDKVLESDVINHSVTVGSGGTSFTMHSITMLAKSIISPIAWVRG